MIQLKVNQDQYKLLQKALRYAERYCREIPEDYDEGRCKSARTRWMDEATGIHELACKLGDKDSHQSDIEDIVNFSWKIMFDGRNRIWQYTKGEWGEVRFHVGAVYGLLMGLMIGFSIGIILVFA